MKWNSWWKKCCDKKNVMQTKIVWKKCQIKRFFDEEKNVMNKFLLQFFLCVEINIFEEKRKKLWWKLFCDQENNYCEIKFYYEI